MDGTLEQILTAIYEAHAVIDTLRAENAALRAGVEEIRQEVLALQDAQREKPPEDAA